MLSKFWGSPKKGCRLYIMLMITQHGHNNWKPKGKARARSKIRTYTKYVRQWRKHCILDEEVTIFVFECINDTNIFISNEIMILRYQAEWIEAMKDEVYMCFILSRLCRILLMLLHSVFNACVMMRCHSDTNQK